MSLILIEVSVGGTSHVKLRSVGYGLGFEGQTQFG